MRAFFSCFTFLCPIVRRGSRGGDGRVARDTHDSRRSKRAGKPERQRADGSDKKGQARKKCPRIPYSGGKSAPAPAQPAPGASPKTMSNGWENTDTLAYSRFVALQHKKRRNLGPCSAPPVERTDPTAWSRAWAQPGASVLSVPPGEARRLVKLLELPLSCKTSTQRGSRLIPQVPQLHPKPDPWQPGPFLGNTPMPA